MFRWIEHWVDQANDNIVISPHSLTISQIGQVLGLILTNLDFFAKMLSTFGYEKEQLRF